MRNKSGLTIPFPLKLALFWLIYFFLFRIVFILFHFDKLPKGVLAETFSALITGYLLDLSMASYLTILPFVLWIINQFYSTKIFERINTRFIKLILFIVTLVSMANIKMYGEWATLLNYRAVSYLKNPGEVLSFIEIKELLLLLIILCLVWLLTFRLYKIVATGFSLEAEKNIYKAAYLLIFPFLLIIGIRGGIRLTPVNESAAYYSSFIINNHIAVNPGWYFAHSILEAKSEVSPYKFMDEEKAKMMTEKLLAENDSSYPSILKIQKPNIVLIILESWTADILNESITPNTIKLTKEGLLFSRSYSSGSRTEQGIAALLSGFPAQPNNSILTNPSKAEKLPNLNLLLKEHGYSSSFYYGGEGEFANMKSYLINSGFEKIIDKNNFKKEEMNSKWGAHDEYVLQKNLKELNNEKQPFFSVVLTLSTHEPFEVPLETPYNKKDEASKFKRAAYYTDSCLGEYFREAKKQNWVSNTLFILVADHGHRLPLNRNLNTAPAKKIIMLMSGDAIKDELRGASINKIMNHHDLPAILLSQLNIPYSQFNWSRNVLSRDYKQFAYFANENVLGWKTSNMEMTFDFVTKKITDEKGKEVPDSLMTDAKAYLQTLYNQYLQY